MLTFTKESVPVSLERLAGFLFLRLGLLLLVVDLAGSTTPASPQDDKSSRGGAGTLNGWFVFKEHEPPSVCTKAGGVFISPAHVVKFYCRS